MTQSSDRQKKEPLPVPPLSLPTKPQGITDIENKTTISSSSDLFSSLDKKTTISPQKFDLSDFDDNDDNDDLESEEKTQLNNPGMLPPLNNQGKFPPLTPPPLSPPGRSPLNNQNVQSKGQNTILAAMVDHINSEHAKHIITIEDPVEFVHKSRKSLIKQREVGMHTLKFDNALKASLREDADIILVGEMRDKETVNTALKAAQTGHLVMGTLHTKWQ
jgi:hypothetical protein